ncbi:uncharacterized protein L969DRAFT_47366 [Mixia osmundae IAM 14324]|uniref:Mediator of RNA polymerase II transcription subunit 5 n=1 Tax=Mixia osmundae (strain CBS 9802 / IAM 14324 / JCM 22182 / KY 12970) TaxID=764103 RepID=G7E9R4_MIXOS|nr:uncharacterized protein L969DRAFT_47366 [Mixia osmundae IAM 14324]KEI40014.1 hypothetical protein L969DRAFT_47366 [Mixia osmundae IAM 14324]GAA99383.1 hypothetical protein E5Q_06079 [Mixia osmundae IAM 14324]
MKAELASAACQELVKLTRACWARNVESSAWHRLVLELLGQIQPRPNAKLQPCIISRCLLSWVTSSSLLPSAILSYAAFWLAQSKANFDVLVKELCGVVSSCDLESEHLYNVSSLCRLLHAQKLSKVSADANALSQLVIATRNDEQAVYLATRLIPFSASPDAERGAMRALLALDDRKLEGLQTVIREVPGMTDTAPLKEDAPSMPVAFDPTAGLETKSVELLLELGSSPDAQLTIHDMIDSAVQGATSQQIVRYLRIRTAVDGTSCSAALADILLAMVEAVNFSVTASSTDRTVGSTPTVVQQSFALYVFAPHYAQAAHLIAGEESSSAIAEALQIVQRRYDGARPLDPFIGDLLSRIHLHSNEDSSTEANAFREALAGASYSSEGLAEQFDRLVPGESLRDQRACCQILLDQVAHAEEDAGSMCILLEALLLHPHCLAILSLHMTPDRLIQPVLTLLRSFQAPAEGYPNEPEIFAALVSLLQCLIARLPAPATALAGDYAISSEVVSPSSLDAVDQEALNAWIAALFGSEGISDDLTNTTKPTRLLGLGTVIVQQALLAYERGKLSLESAKSGLSYFSQHPLVHLLPSVTRFLVEEKQRLLPGSTVLIDTVLEDIVAANLPVHVRKLVDAELVGLSSTSLTDPIELPILKELLLSAMTSANPIAFPDILASLDKMPVEHANRIILHAFYDGLRHDESTSFMRLQTVNLAQALLTRRTGESALADLLDECFTPTLVSLLTCTVINKRRLHLVVTLLDHLVRTMEIVEQLRSARTSDAAVRLLSRLDKLSAEAVAPEIMPVLREIKSRLQ